MASSLLNLGQPKLRVPAASTTTTMGAAGKATPLAAVGAAVKAAAAGPIVTVHPLTGDGQPVRSLRPHVGLRRHFHSTLIEWKLLLEHRLAPEQPVERRQYIFQPDHVQELCVRKLLTAAGIQSDGSNVAVYGSRSRQSDDNLSDWDLLVVSDEATCPLQHRRGTDGIISFDVTRGGIPALVRQLSQRNADNNNWLLNAIVEARPLGTPSERAEIILRYADTFYRKGPQRLTRIELSRMKGEIKSRWQAVKVSLQRADISPEYEFLSRVRSDQLSVRMLYMRFVLDAKWTTSLNPLLERCKKDYPEFWASLETYYSGCDTRANTRCLEKLVDSFLREIG